MIQDEEAIKIKEHLLQQLDNFPEDKRETIKEKIEALSNEELEQFLIQNNLMQKTQTNEQKDTTPNKQCVFCSIIYERIPSHEIDKNKNNIAILEINPLSKGHVLIVPKEHLKTEKIPSDAFTLAKKIAKKLKSKFKPKEVKISSQELFGHALVEVLPLYGDEKDRKKATEKELIILQEQLKARPKQKKEKKAIITSAPSTKPNLPKFIRLP